MKIKQLGNGSGFSVDSVSSSFLIKSHGSTILFDCGFNVVSKLKSLGELENVDNVFISHMHEDHISNLATLIYMRYFLLNKCTNVYCGENVFADLQNYLFKCTTEMKSGKMVPAQMFVLYSCYLHDEIGAFKVSTFLTYHGCIDSYGLLLNDQNYANSALMISGDTKAYEKIEYEARQSETNNIYIFHDYSEWDNPSRNVHACDSDMKSEYSEKFIKSLNYYHDDKSFNSEWQELAEENIYKKYTKKEK